MSSLWTGSGDLAPRRFCPSSSSPDLCLQELGTMRRPFLSCNGVLQGGGVRHTIVTLRTIMEVY